MTGRITVPAASIIPQGVGAPPPPGLDPKKGKLMCIKVRMLDDTIGVFHLGHKALGSALFDEVCRHLNLLECDYFGLEFLDITGNRCWLDKEKPILRQITSARSDARFFFIVKFYPPNPTDVEEEYTRFLFAAQIKRDLASGQLVVNENTAALMASYIVQSECGDYCAEDYPDHTYLSAVHFIPNQSADFEKQVMENHRKLIGLGPADSDLQLLEVARRVEFYGIKFHPAKDIEGTSVNLCVLHLGVKVYHQLTCANTFSWAKIRKLSFKRKKFLIKLHPDSFAYYKDTIEFIFESRNECKMFWKKCIEHHSFFRCSQVPNRSSANKQQQSRFFNHGSSFRYSGRTHQQLLDYIREHHRRREPFTRPVHSSYNKCNYEQRSLPRSIVPSVRQNGGAVLNTGEDYLSSRTSTLNGPIMAEYSAGATDNYERRPPSSEAPYIDDTTILVGPPPAPVEDPSYSILRHKVKGANAARKILMTNNNNNNDCKIDRGANIVNYCNVGNGALDSDRRLTTSFVDNFMLTNQRSADNVNNWDFGTSKRSKIATSNPSILKNVGFSIDIHNDDNASEASYRLSDSERQVLKKSNRRSQHFSSIESVSQAPPICHEKPKVRPIVPPKPRVQCSQTPSCSIPLEKQTIIEIDRQRIIETPPVIQRRVETPPTNVDTPPTKIETPPTKVETPPTKVEAPPLKVKSPPTIEIDSEEQPDVKHKIINGEIPYILHVRQRISDVEATAADSIELCNSQTFYSLPFDNNGKRKIRDKTQGPQQQHRSRSVKTGRDVVSRKRLPSRSNFSSQDHSVSPELDRDLTSFVNRMQNASAQLEKRLSKRRDLRRATQPIKLTTDQDQATAAAEGHFMVKNQTLSKSQPCFGGEKSDKRRKGSQSSSSSNSIGANLDKVKTTEKSIVDDEDDDD